VPRIGRQTKECRISSMRYDKIWRIISVGSRRRGERSEFLTRRSFFRRMSMAAASFSVFSKAALEKVLAKEDDVN
jgi:hypothetical protein